MTATTPAAAPALPLDHAAVRSIILGILLAMFLAALDQTIVATALPTIGRELGDLAHLPWVVTAYLLTSTAVTPLYGKLSDIHGRRRTLLASIGLFMLGSLACAVAPSMPLLILARGLQGLGGGGLISLAQTIIADVVAPKERARYQGYIASVFVASSVGGPVLGGFFAEHLHWSLIFWINLPLGFAAVGMTWGALRRLPRHERPHRLDVPGALLITLATVALLLALSWGGTRYPWASAPTVALLLGAAVAAALFAARLLTAAEPLLPLPILRNPVVGCGTAAAFFSMGTLIGLSIYVPVYLQAVLRLSPSGSGLALIPLMGGVVTGATASGRWMMRAQHYKRLPLAGLAAAAAGAALVAARPSGLPLPAIEVVLGAIGIGIGTVLPVTTVAVQNAVALHELGTATGVMNFFRSLGGAIAVAAFGAIVLAGLGGHGATAEGLAEVARRQGLDLAPAFRWAFLAAALGLCAGWACLLAMAERPLRGGAPKAAPSPAAG